METKVKLKGHESFSIREGWLTKGLVEVNKNGKIFSEKNATDILGIGTNMVKSLKYWLITANLIEEKTKCNYVLSELGQLIYDYDLYMENIFTLYMIHLQIALNEEKAYIWNTFFNYCNLKEFTKKEYIDFAEYVLENENKEYNEKLLVDEIGTFLKTYTNEKKESNPENNFSCPLTELELIKKNGHDKFQRTNSSMSKLNEYIVFWMILHQCGTKDSINIDELITDRNCTAKMLNLDKVELNEYLEILKRYKLITINKTAGLNMIYINKRYTLKEIFEHVFKEEK